VGPRRSVGFAGRCLSSNGTVHGACNFWQPNLVYT